MIEDLRIQLSKDLDGSVLFLSDCISLGEGQRESWETITRVVKFEDDFYGEVDITRAKLNQMVRNFDSGTYGQDIFIDVSHRPDYGSAGQIKELKIERNKLRARIDWTEYGTDAVIKRGFRYFSADYQENYKDPENGKKYGALLRGAGLTTRPRVKMLDPVDPTRLQLSFDDDRNYVVSPRVIHLLSEEISIMKDKFIKLLAEALKKIQGLTDDAITQLSGHFGEAIEGITDEAQANILLSAFTGMGQDIAKQLAESGQPGAIQLDFSDLKNALSGMQSGAAGLSKEDVLQLMEDQQKAQQQQRADTEAKRTANIKLFSDAINGQDGFTDDLKKQLCEGMDDLITAGMTETQIKALSDNQIALGNRMTAQSTLSGMGFDGPAGSVQISINDTNNIKELQETVDRRLGLTDMSDSKRFAATGGKLPEENKKFADKVLAQFDQERAAQLHAEHKMLAGGDGLVSDVNVPVSWERTVIREALYRLIGLQFVNVGVESFSTSYMIPYSYRDTTAASRTNARKYEGQPVARAGVKQAADTAYNIPQKLAFEVSDELRYLTAASMLNWDAVAENQRNASRIVGEDTEHLIFNEIMNASDEFATTAVVDEALTSQVDGTDNVFILANFPVVHPRANYDLQGNLIGAITNPISVTLGGVDIDEYNGTGTQAAGNYYVMDYNLGELRIVDEAGVLQTPVNATALLVDYSYTTNVYAFDTDLGGALAEDHWNTFLYRFGLRKSIIEDDRYYMANMGQMSGTVANQVEQAKQFAANFRRPGTDLSMDGNIGRIKDVPIFKSSAPGLYMGDQRVIIGESGVTRFRMAKAWQLGELENQKDANGRFTGKKEAYGDQYVVCHTPTQLKGALTSIVLYSTTARVARAE